MEPGNTYEFAFHTSISLWDCIKTLLFFYGVISFTQDMYQKIRGRGITSSDPILMYTGNENFSISGLVYEGRPIPSIDVKDKSLFIDGQFKRRLARNSKTYNKGVGIFVDGKYVG